MAVKKIASDTLDFILASCKASHPREFGALLEAEGDTIVNIIYLPGTDSTSRSVSIKTWMMPNMPHAGSVHSHPSGAIRPSEQDLIFFRANEINIIVGEPYTRESWKVFDRNGNLTALEIVEYDFDENEWIKNEVFKDEEWIKNDVLKDEERIKNDVLKDGEGTQNDIYEEDEVGKNNSD